MSDMNSLGFLIFGAEFINDSMLIFFVSLHLPDLILFSLKLLFKASDDIFELLNMEDTFTNLDFIDLCMVMQLNPLLAFQVVDLLKVSLGQTLYLHSVPIVDLGGDLLPDVLIQVLDLFEHTALELVLGLGA